MLQINTKVRYGLRAITALARTDTINKVCSAKKIAEKENISVIYLEQIFSKLKKKGILVSTRGAHGGFFLNKPPSDITVYDVMDALGERILLAPCSGCDDDKDVSCEALDDCIMASFWNGVNTSLYDFFNNVTVEDIIVGKVDFPN